MRESRGGDGRRRAERVWGWERKQRSIAKRPTDTKGRRMTGTRVKPAQRNEEEEEEEEGDGKDGREGEGVGGVKRRFKPTV